MGNRIIKESIHTSEDVNRMTDFQFRLWVSLITYVDDYGRGDARPAVIKGQCFPLRDRITVKDIDAALVALAGIGCVGLYEVDGKPYLYFPAWESHQRIQARKSRYPEPSHGESRKVTVSHGESPSEYNPNTIQSEYESESEKEIAPPSAAKLPRKKYGQYENVLLSDADLEKLQAEFPNDWKEWIEKLSRYIKSKGVKYKDHLATIRNWARRDMEGDAANGKKTQWDPSAPIHDDLDWLESQQAGRKN